MMQNTLSKSPVSSALGVEDCLCCIGQSKRTNGVFIFSVRFLFVNIDAAPYITAAFVDVTPPQTDNLTGPQASDDLKPIGIDIFIRYLAAAQQSGIDVEQFEHITRLQDCLDRIASPGGWFEIFRGAAWKCVSSASTCKMI